MGSNVHGLRELNSSNNPDASGGSFWRDRTSGGSVGFFDSSSHREQPRCVDLFIPDFTWRSFIVWIGVVQTVVFFFTLGFGSQHLVPTGHVLSLFGSSFGPPIAQGHIWRLFTPIFLHGSIWHLLFNVFFQTRMGIQIERSYGIYKTVALYFITGVAGNLFSVAVAPCKYAVGASTAGFGLIGLNMAEMAIAWNSLANKDQAIFNIVLFVVISVMMSASPGSAVDWRGHLGGFVAGFSIGLLYNKHLEHRIRWLKTFGIYAAYGMLAALYIACTLVIFLVPMTDKIGNCIR